MSTMTRTPVFAAAPSAYGGAAYASYALLDWLKINGRAEVWRDAEGFYFSPRPASTATSTSSTQSMASPTMARTTNPAYVGFSWRLPPAGHASLRRPPIWS